MEILKEMHRIGWEQHRRVERPMAKSAGKLRKKVSAKAKGFRVVTHDSASGHFAFPSAKTVKSVGAYLITNARANAKVKTVRKAYKSAGHQIVGTTGDGVIIVKPAGKPDSFKLSNLKKALSDVRVAKG